MAAPKTERLLNLLIMLLVQRTYISKVQIRALLYADQGLDAFEKMFERDKEELRSLGVPIEIGQMDAYFDDEPGYRIRPDEFALPEIELEPDEAAVIGLATKVWQHATLARATSDAVRKLRAAGVEVDEDALQIAQPRLHADEPAFDDFWEAAQERVPLTFDYRRSSDAKASTRHLQPWGVTRFSGRWYAVGWDTDRDDERIFRLSRVQGTPRKEGEPGSYTVPADLDLREITGRLTREPAAAPGTVLARTGAATPLRRTAVQIETDVAGPDTTTGWDRLTLPRAGAGAADEVLAFGGDVYIDEPGPLRDAILERLRAVVS